MLHGAKAVDSEPGSGAHNGYAVAPGQLFNPVPASAAIAFSLLVSLALWSRATPSAERSGHASCCSVHFCCSLFFQHKQTNPGLSRALLLSMVLIGGFPLASRLRAYFDQRGEPNPALLVTPGITSPTNPTLRIFIIPTTWKLEMRQIKSMA